MRPVGEETTNEFEPNRFDWLAAEYAVTHAEDVGPVAPEVPHVVRRAAVVTTEE